MNDKQKKISNLFLFIECTLLLTITCIISFQVYKNNLAQQGNIFNEIIAEQTLSWTSPILILLVGISITVAILFLGLWHINKK